MQKTVQSKLKTMLYESENLKIFFKTKIVLKV